MADNYVHFQFYEFDVHQLNETKDKKKIHFMTSYDEVSF